MGVARWTFVLGCVRLGHRVITKHVCAQDFTRSYPRSIENGEFTLIIKDWNLRSWATSDACEGGGSHLGTGLCIFQHSTTLSYIFYGHMQGLEVFRCLD